MMTNERLETDKKSIDDTGIQRTEMQKEIVISRLREMGCRITRQRMILLDIYSGKSVLPARRFIIRRPSRTVV